MTDLFEKLSPLPIYIGWDSRETRAYDLACDTAVQNASRPLAIRPLILEELQQHGHSTRKYGTSHRAGKRIIWDHVSGAPCSTEFANTRFFVPRLALGGWALFMDCDVVVYGDLARLFNLADPRYAVMCVQHQIEEGSAVKMDGQVQQYYARKNWSSVMLWNCSHPGNRRLTFELLNETPGRDLHRFCWLRDSEIGVLGPEWNWLVGVQPRMAAPQIAHYTLGGPWIHGWEGGEHDADWLAAEADSRAGYRAGEP